MLVLHQHKNFNFLYIYDKKKMSKVDSEFSNKIKAWSAYEQKSQELKTQLNKINESRDSLASEIINYMRMNNLQKTALNLGSNKIYYHDDTQYNNLTFQFLKECLNIYFHNDHKQRKNTIIYEPFT
jgi:hypothetical protein